MKQYRNSSMGHRMRTVQIGDRVINKKHPDRILSIVNVELLDMPYGTKDWWITAESDDKRYSVFGLLSNFARVDIEMTPDELDRFVALLREYCNGCLPPGDRDEYFRLLGKLEPSSSS